MKSQISLITAVIFAALLASANGQGVIVAQHSGATNPTTEGFTLQSYGSPQLGPVLNDQGVDAWSIYMLNTDAAQYGETLNASQQNELAGADWMFTCTLRILQAPETPSYDISSAFYTGAEMFGFYFGRAANGDPIVQVRENSLILSPTFDVAGGGASYTSFSLSYHADTDSADLLVNGTELYSGMVAHSFVAQPSLYWSGYQHANDVQANWSQVSLRVVPEPSTVCLVFVGIIFLVCAKGRMASAGA